MSDEIVAVTSIDDADLTPAVGVVLELDEADLAEGSLRMNNADNLQTRIGSRTSWIGPLLGGVGIGAALMYLFDPDRGRGRRARLSDQLTSKANRLGETVEGRARDLRNRTKGLLHDVGIISTSKQRSEESGDQPNRLQTENESTSPRLGDQLV
jgi:hypothetical protein